MYKKKVSKAIIVMLSLVMFSCGKKQINSEKATNNLSPMISNSVGIHPIDNYNSQFLVFDDRNEGDLVLDQIKNLSISELDAWSDEMGIVNSRKYFITNPTHQNNNDAVENEILSTVINKDGIVQIGDIVYMHDLNSGQVWTLNLTLSNYSKLPDLINKQFNESCMNIFNLDEEDIIEKAETGVVGISQKKLRGIFGIDIHPTPITYTISSPSGDFTIDWKSSYQNLGIIKSLQSKLRHYTGPANMFNPFNAPVAMGYDLVNSSGKFKKQGSSTWITITGNSHWYGVAIRGKCDNRPYIGFRRLKEIQFNPVWFCEDNLGVTRTLFAQLIK
jgi:hypothetical protein